MEQFIHVELKFYKTRSRKTRYEEEQRKKKKEERKSANSEKNKGRGRQSGASKKYRRRRSSWIRIEHVDFFSMSDATAYNSRLTTILQKLL